MRTKNLAAGLAAAVAITLPFVFAAPASAATLPAGDELWTITCDFDEVANDDYAVLYSVSAADAVATKVGTGTGIVGDCAGQAAYNPVTGQSFYLSWATSPGALAKIDLATGLSTVTPFSGAGPLDPNSIAIGTDGTGYMLETTRLSKFNVETGAAELLGDIGLSDLYSFAVDPTSGRLYGMRSTGDTYLIDPVAVTATFQGNILGEPGGLGFYSLQIDTAGTWWVEQDRFGGSFIETGVKPNPDTDTQFETVGTLATAGDPVEFPRTDSLLITYPKALAATGMDATVLIGAGAAAALLLLMGGAVLVLRRRRVA